MVFFNCCRNNINEIDTYNTPIFRSRNLQNPAKITPLTIYNSKINRKIDLIINNSDMNGYVIKTYLKMFNHNSEQTTSYKEALKLLEENKYNIVWIDLRIFNMKALHFIDVIRTKFNYNGIIIGIIVDCDVQSINKFKKLGITDVLVKPIDIKELEKLIKKYRKN
jgi:DNA-binding response OmpR family regulator